MFALGVRKKMNSQQQSLISLIQEYEAAGWLNGKQAYEYTRLLQKHPRSQDYTLKEIQKAVATAGSSSNRLNTTTTKQEEKKEAVAPAAVAVPPILHPAHHHNHMDSSNHRQHVVSWEGDKPTNKLTPIKEVLPVYLESADFKTVLKDDAAIKEVFVEMCFYARLGFLQPPCCLRCTYNEAKEQRSVDVTCRRWVVWRKQTDQPLHPDTLGNNIIMFQCHAVRKLLNGKPVAGQIWDAKRKQLIVLTSKTK